MCAISITIANSVTWKATKYEGGRIYDNTNFQRRSDYSSQMTPTTGEYAFPSAKHIGLNQDNQYFQTGLNQNSLDSKTCSETSIVWKYLGSFRWRSLNIGRLCRWEVHGRQEMLTDSDYSMEMIYSGLPKVSSDGSDSSVDVDSCTSPTPPTPKARIQ